MLDFKPSDSFHVPQTLSANKTKLRRVLIVGACVVNDWKFAGEKLGFCIGCDHILFNNVAQLPNSPPFPLAAYDLQVIALPFRPLLPETSCFRLDYKDLDGYEKLLRDAEGRLSMLLDAAMRWNKEHSLTTFVTNFFIPQQNAMGRLFPRYDIRNPVYFTERLNFRLTTELAKYANTYLLDIDQTSASLGRRHIQEDFLCATNHGSLLSNYDWEFDQDRLEKPALKATELVEVKTGQFIRDVWLQLNANYRILRQEDSVKMIVTDLDDTLWRGTLNEQDESIGKEATEGWPLGYIEALTYLKKRGVILAIVSKNEESLIRKSWPKPLKNVLRLDDFAFVRINWKTKAENVAEIVATANLLPTSVVFIDDNPVERESVLAALPGIRVLGNDPYSLKRTLLWSSETQVVSVTDESARRTDMMKAQAHREEERKAMSRDEFLRSLSVKVRLKSISSSSDPRFARVFELLNKTNQFNTTGKRWFQVELIRALSSGSRLLAFFVEDKFSDYGLVGILLVSGSQIDQYVMSCRVLGMDVELAALALALNDMRASGHAFASANLIETETNFPVRDLYQRAGFEYQNDRWNKSLIEEIVYPRHIDTAWLSELDQCSASRA